MNIKRMISQGYQSLMMHRSRTVLSMLGILFGVAAVIAMLAVGEGAKREALEQISALGTNNLIVRRLEVDDGQKAKNQSGNAFSISLEDAEYLRKHIPGATNIAGINRVKAEVQAARMQSPIEIIAVTDGYASIKGLSLSQGRFLTSLDIQQRRRICILGHAAARSLGRLGQLSQTVRIEGIEFRVVGILNSQQVGKHPVAHPIDQCVFIPLGAEMSFPHKGEKREALSEVIIQMASSENMMQRALLVKRILNQRHPHLQAFQVIVPYELMNQVLKTQYTFNIVLVSIAAISLIVGGIGIMNIMLATIFERMREIGIRRAVGATPRHIMSQFLVETLLLSCAGGVLGLVGGCVVSICISVIAGWPVVITGLSVVLALGMALIVGLCAGLYPAMKAARMHPIDALRQY